MAVLWRFEHGRTLLLAICSERSGEIVNLHYVQRAGKVCTAQEGTGKFPAICTVLNQERHIFIHFSQPVSPHISTHAALYIHSTLTYLHNVDVADGAHERHLHGVTQQRPPRAHLMQLALRRPTARLAIAVVDLLAAVTHEVATVSAGFASDGYVLSVGSERDRTRRRKNYLCV